MEAQNSLLPKIYNSHNDYQLFCSKIWKYLNETDAKINHLKDGLIDDSSYCTGTTIVLPSQIGNNYNGVFVNSGNTTVVSDKKDDESFRVLIGIVSAVVLGVGAFFVGKSLAQFKASSEKLVELNDLKKFLKKDKDNINKKCRVNLKDNDHFYHINKIVKLDLKQVNNINWNNRANLISTATILAGAALALSAVLFSSYAVMLSFAALGTAAAAGAGAFLLCKWGYNLFDESAKKTVEVINEHLNELCQLPTEQVSYSIACL